MFVLGFCRFDHWRVCRYKKLCPSLRINVSGSRLMLTEALNHAGLLFFTLINNEFTIQEVAKNVEISYGCMSLERRKI